MNLHKMIEICLKDDNMCIFVMINALICINNYVITCINSMLSRGHVAGGHACPRGFTWMPAWGATWQEGWQVKGPRVSGPR